jgi:hypothetical protein
MRTTRKLAPALAEREQLISDLESMTPVEWLATVTAEYFGEGLSGPDANTAVVQALSSAMAVNESFLASMIPSGGLVSFKLAITNEDGKSNSALFSEAPGPVALLELLLKNAEVGDKVEVTLTCTDSVKKIADWWPFDVAMAEELLRPSRGVSLDDEVDDNSKSIRMRKLGKRVKVAISTLHGPPKWRLPHVIPNWSNSDNAVFCGLTVGWRLSAVTFCVSISRKGSEC